jgi:hypothetical protein
MRKPYTTTEMIRLWHAYLEMLNLQDRKEKYSKTAYRNVHLQIHESRTRGSYEAFMMNISTARDKAGLPILKGYKPSMPNYSKYLDKLCVMTDEERAKDFVDDLKEQQKAA